MYFALYALVEIVAGVLGGALELQHRSFLFRDSLDDALFAFGALGLLASLLRYCGRLSAAGFASLAGVAYALGKSVYVAVAVGSPLASSVACCAVGCAGAIGAFLSTVTEERALTKRAPGRDQELSHGAYGRLENGDGDKDAPKKLGMRAILRMLRPYFWPSTWAGRLAVLSTLLFVTLSKVCSVVSPLILAAAADAVADRAPVSRAVNCALAYAAVSFGGKVFKECQSLAYLRVQKYAFIDLASDTFAHLHSLSLQWALSKKMGEVVRVTDRGIAGCDTFMKYGVLYIGPSLAEAAAVCILFYVHFRLWELSVLVFSAVLLYAGLTVKMTLWRKRFRSAMNKSDNAWHDRLTDSLVNFETVKYFTAEAYECERFSEEIAHYQKSSVEVQASLSALNIAQQVILCACLGGALALSAIAVHENEASVGGFVAVNVWVINLFAPLNFLGTVYNALITAMVDLGNLSELLAQRPLVEDPPSGKVHPGGGGLFESGLAVAFEDVTFAYPGAAPDSGLRGVSFAAEAGSSLGVVGPTGAGKSTCGRLLFRFFDACGGRVLVGGADVRTVTQKSLRSLMGVVPQDTVLFNATLDYNIRYGRLGSTEADRDAAAERAALYAFGTGQREGWDTIVGERGLKLSGGEKQRVAIARLFVKNPPVVILDEATSALDSRTEAEIQGALAALSDTRTAIVIAHRLGTIAKSNAIVVLAAGRVVERGTHDELLEIGGEYAAMWRVQSEASGILEPAAAVVEADETKEG